MTRMIAVRAAARSAAGPAYMIPSIPRKSGKSRIRGRRNMICLVRDRKVPILGFAIDVKKLDVIGCRKFRKVKKRNI